MVAKPRALLISTLLYENGLGMARALADAGFQVGAYCPSFNLLNKVRGIQKLGSAKALVPAASAIAHSMAQWRPDVVLPCDDHAVRVLHQIHGQGRECSEVIERSLGEPGSFPQVGSRAGFLSAMSKVSDASVPEWTLLRQTSDLAAVLEAAQFPLVLKREVSAGGMGVRIVSSAQEAPTAYAELTGTPSWLSRLRGYAVEATIGVPLPSRPAGWNDVVAQRYVHGRAANRAVFCWKGEVLAGISAEVLQSSAETAPATVAKHIEHVEMETASAAAVKLLGISGFCGFDFVLEQGTRRAWLLEMNPRLTAISHLPFGQGADLIAAMAGMYLRSVPLREVSSIRPRLPQDTVALFPKEMIRDPFALQSSKTYHDVPWDDPQLVSACLRRIAQTDSYGRIRKSLALGARFSSALLWRTGSRPQEPQTIAAPR